MKVLIIEDEPLAAERLGNLVCELHDEIKLVATLDSVQRSVVWLSQNTVDLIFMDIQLADGLSFEIFEKIEIKTPVIFTTAVQQGAR
ncbi:MAG: response regulator [Cytophagales bacterium]|nr:response regulator [Cytophagales bacterium]